MLGLLVVVYLLAGSGALAPAPPTLPALPASPAQAERIVEIRVQGNYRTSEDEILRIAAINVGDPLAADAIDAIRARLEKSGKFDEVEILKRWRTIDSTEDIVLVVIVREASGGTTNPFGKAVHALTHPLVLPIATYVDGYGFSGGSTASGASVPFSGSGLTYGANLSPVNLLGQNLHVAIPLTWGATREAAFTLDRSFPASSPLTRVAGGVGIRQRTNPFYEAADRRLSVDGRVERAFSHVLRVGLFGSLSDVSFDPNDDAEDPFVSSRGGTFGTWGGDVVFDTRANPDLPRNAVLLQFGLERLQPEEGGIGRHRADTRGYLGLPLASVLTLRALQAGATDALPGYEQFLLGGEDSVRGFRPGYDAGDNVVLGSAEWRVPFTSPLSFGRVGAALFVDSGAVYPHGLNLSDVNLRTGVGGGLFLNATLFNVKIDVARGIDRGWRVHALGRFAF